MYSDPTDSGHELASLMWIEAVDSISVNMLPAGAAEAHGPHFKRGSKVIIAQAAERGTADRFTEISDCARIAPAGWGKLFTLALGAAPSKHEKTARHVRDRDCR